MSQDSSPAAALVANSTNPDDERLKTFVSFFETMDIDGYITFLSENKTFLESTLKKDGHQLLRFYRCYVIWKTLKFQDYIGFTKLQEMMRCEKPEDVLTVVSNVSTYDHYLSRNLRLEVNRYLVLAPQPISLISNDIRDVMTEILAYNPTTATNLPVDVQAVANVFINSLATNPHEIIQIYRSMFDILRSLNVSKPDVAAITRHAVLQGQHLSNVVYLELFLLALMEKSEADVAGPLLAKTLEAMATRPVVRDLKILIHLPCTNLSLDQRKIVEYITDGNIDALSASFQPGTLLSTMCRNARILKLITLAETKELLSVTELQASLYLPTQEEAHNFLIEQERYVKLVADEVGCRLMPLASDLPSTPSGGSSATNSTTSIIFNPLNHVPPPPSTPLETK
uniref:CCR4-NOT transcription complex subunit 11 n=1 Tax=Panagrellus redivivus TaxID=6233 RepID=A0A7E4VTA7_PANRE